MIPSAEVTGLILNFIGSFILLLVVFLGCWHQKTLTNPWSRRYWWMGWRPIWRDTKTFRWKFKWKATAVREGAISPQHQWNAVGFLYMISGFVLQLKAIIH